MSPTEITANKNQGGVQSLEIGLSILDVLIKHYEPMMLKDIAQVMQMHPAKVHRYLVSLIRKDYARQLDDGRYRLGDRIDALAYIGFQQNNLFERLTRVANEIKDVLNCGVQIAKWFDEGPIIIQFIEPDSPINIVTRIGSRIPLTTSATGQLFASHQPDEIIKPLVFSEWKSSDSNPISAFSQHSEQSDKPISDAELSAKWQHFTRLQSCIRTQGYTTVAGTLLMGINAISVPIFSPKLGLAVISASTQVRPLEYAITIIGTSEQLPVSEQHDVAEKILAIVRRYNIV